MRPFVLAVLLPLAGCSIGSDSAAQGAPGGGASGSRSYPIVDFARVDLRGPDDVTVQVGGDFSVRADGEPRLLEQLVIEKRGDVLRIARRDGFRWTGRGAVVTVTMPAITGASIVGSGDLGIDRVKAARFDAALGGSGNMTIGAIAVQSAGFSLAGSGNIAVAGTAEKVSFDVAGPGDIAGSDLHAGAAEVSIAGSGSVTAQVEGPATVSMRGSGDVDLGAKARCSTSKLGSGKVHCGG